MNLRSATRKAYNSTDVALLDKLLAERTRWLKKSTLARNKLSDVEKRIVDFASRLAHEKVGITDERSTDKTH